MAAAAAAAAVAAVADAAGEVHHKEDIIKSAIITSAVSLID